VLQHHLHLLRETLGLFERLQAASHQMAARSEAGSRLTGWSCSDAHERNAEVRAVSDAADTVSVVEIARLVHEVWDEAGGHQRHVGEEQLEVRDAGAVVHVHSVPAQPRVLHEDLHRYERGAEPEIAK
jgi:hypothetical protein